MWQYKITNSDLGYRIYRERDWEKQYYDVKWGWNTNKTYAKIFFHRSDAESGLVVIRRKWDRIEETSKEEEKAEKQSWSEL